jgi:hypothetical protein
MCAFAQKHILEPCPPITGCGPPEAGEPGDAELGRMMMNPSNLSKLAMIDVKEWIAQFALVAVIAFAIGFGFGVESTSGTSANTAAAPVADADSPWDSIPWSFGAGGGARATMQ